MRGMVSRPLRRAINKQRRVAAAVILAPTVATVVAILLLFHEGAHPVAVVSLAVMYLLGMIGNAAGMHRYLAHRSFKTSRWFGSLLAILGSMNAQGSPLFWVSTHRRHHSISDEHGDPFSPNLSGSGLRGRLRGIWHAYIGWMFAHDPTNPAQYCRDLLMDRTLFTINRFYFLWIFLGLATPSLICGLYTRTYMGALEGLLWGGFVRMFLINNAMWCVGTYCHLYGSRPFPIKNRSTNNFLVSFLSFGEGLHNNHHAFPSSAVNAFEWWEPDFCGWFLRVAQAVGLVWDVRAPSQQAIRKLKQS